MRNSGVVVALTLGVTAVVLLSACTSAPAVHSPRSAVPASSSSVAASLPAVSTTTTDTGPTSNQATVTPTAPSGALTPSGNVEVIDCQGTAPQALPVSVVLTCSDGGSQVTDIIWTVWNPTTARGTGTLVQNSCTPNCAQGTAHKHSATILLAAPIDFDGARLFTKVTVTAPGATPASSTQILPG